MLVIPNVAFACLHYLDLETVADVLKAHPASIFRVKSV